MGINQGLRKNFHSATVENGESVIFTHSISGPLMIQDVVIEGLFYVVKWLPNDCLLGIQSVGPQTV